MKSIVHIENNARGYRFSISLLIIIAILIYSCNSYDNSEQAIQKGDASTENNSPQIDEKAALLNSYFGDYGNQKNHKKVKGKVVLEVWSAYVDYCRGLSSKMQEVMCDGSTYKLPIEYDEIWETRHTDDSIMKLYWKDDKVQAYTGAEYLNLGKLTNNRLTGAAHKITSIYNRQDILRDYTK